MKPVNHLEAHHSHRLLLATNGVLCRLCGVDVHFPITYQLAWVFERPCAATNGNLEEGLISLSMQSPVPDQPE